MDSKKWKLYQSAFIKSIRRGMVDDAVYWGILLYKIGHAENVWRRIFIHLSEDIGIADRELPASIEALYQNYQRLKTRTIQDDFEAEHTEALPFTHAIFLLASAKKSRCVDHAMTYYLRHDEDRQVPDYAIDYHSPMGRRMGRDSNHFRKIASKIKNRAPIKDVWEEKVYKLINSKTVKQHS